MEAQISSNKREERFKTEFETSSYKIDGKFTSKHNPSPTAQESKLSVVNSYRITKKAQNKGHNGDKFDCIDISIVQSEPTLAYNRRTISLHIDFEIGTERFNENLLMLEDPNRPYRSFGAVFDKLSVKPEKSVDRLIEVLDVYIEHTVKSLPEIKNKNNTRVSLALSELQQVKDDLKYGEVRWFIEQNQTAPPERVEIRKT